MAKSNRSNRNDWGVLEMAREKPIAAAATAVGAAAAGLFLWSRRTQINEQLSDLTEKFGQWTESMRASGNDGAFKSASDATRPDSAPARGPRRPAARRRTTPNESVVIDETPAS